MRRSLLLYGLPWLALLPLAPAAGAVTVPWIGEVTLEGTDGGTYSAARLGDLFTGSFTYSASCPGDCLVEPFPPDETNYVFELGSASITGLSITTDGTEASVSIQNDHVLSADEAAFVNLILGGPADPLAQGDAIDAWTAASELADLEWEIVFVSRTASFFDDQSFRAEPPVLAPGDLALFQVFSVGPMDDDILQAAGVLVPEPATGLLLASGLAGLAARRSQLR